MTRSLLLVGFAIVACDRAPAPEVVPVPPAPAVRVVSPPSGCAPPFTGEPLAVAEWHSMHVDGWASPTCVKGGREKFVQYADLQAPGAVRFCVWTSYDAMVTGGERGIGCFRVDLATGAYDKQGGVWFVAPLPSRGAVSGDSPPARLDVVRFGDGVDLMEGVTCRRHVPIVPFPDHEGPRIWVDAAGTVLAFQQGPVPGPAHAFATYDAVTGVRLAAFTIPDRAPDGARIAELAAALVIHNCAAHDAHCAWDRYDPRTGAHLSTFGGPVPFGDAGTAARLDDRRLVAVAGRQLVEQDAQTGVVRRHPALPSIGDLGAGYIVVGLAAGSVVLVGDDGRVLLLDPVTLAIARTILPPRCRG